MEALAAGVRVGPAALGVLATVGCARVPVRRRPRVAVHSSGDELVPVDSTLAPGKIRNSNLHAICARLRRFGAEAIPRPVLRDDREAIRSGLRATLEFAPDAIITTGGISAGDLDHVRDVARELGDDVEVRQVDMKPGKPLVDGLLGGVPYFGLPGNPAACLVSFEIFVRPALARMEGRADGLLPHRRARVLEGRNFPRAGRLQLLRGRVEFDETRQELVLLPLGRQGSHLLSSFADANCLVRVGPEADRLNAGELADVLLLD
jgi:molybdenum cofactor synthesis domain-containing protein